MKHLCNFINEKLKINKHSRLYFNPDQLCDENVVFDLIDDFDDTPEDLAMIINGVDDQFSLFCSFKFAPLSKLDFTKPKDQDALKDYMDSFRKIYEGIVTGRDLGYELRFINGHIEIHCINSGGRGIYYIYAINDDFEEMLTNAFEDDNFEILSILQTDENIIKPIIYEKL